MNWLLGKVSERMSCEDLKIQGILALGGVHKLRLQDLSFFDHLPRTVYIFYGIKLYKKSIF